MVAANPMAGRNACKKPRARRTLSRAKDQKSTRLMQSVYAHFYAIREVMVAQSAIVCRVQSRLLCASCLLILRCRLKVGSSCYRFHQPALYSLFSHLVLARQIVVFRHHSPTARADTSPSRFFASLRHHPGSLLMARHINMASLTTNHTLRP